MGMLVDIGLVQSKKGKTGAIFEELIPDFLDRSEADESPKAYIGRCWERYQKAHPDEDVGTNGKFFELCIATLLLREGILPVYIQAQVAFVPNVEYDFILYTSDRGPVCISTKTTLRERYKQADLEAVALKYVHRRAECYLVNISRDENESLKTKISHGGVIGLDDTYYAFGDEFDGFVSRLKRKPLVLAPEVKVVTSQALITQSSLRSIRR